MDIILITGGKWLFFPGRPRILGDKFFDLCGGRGAVGGAGRLKRLQNVRRQVEGKADIVLSQVFDLRPVFAIPHAARSNPEKRRAEGPAR